MKQHQLVVEVERNSQAGSLDVLEGVQQNFVGVLIVAYFLLLLRNIDRNLDCLASVADCSVQLEGVLWLFGNVVGFTH